MISCLGRNWRENNQKQVKSQTCCVEKHLFVKKSNIHRQHILYSSQIKTNLNIKSTLSVIIIIIIITIIYEL